MPVKLLAMQPSYPNFSWSLDCNWEQQNQVALEAEPIDLVAAVVSVAKLSL